MLSAVLDGLNCTIATLNDTPREIFHLFLLISFSITFYPVFYWWKVSHSEMPPNCLIYVMFITLADHFKLHAQISAQTARHLQPSKTRRYQSDRKFQNVHFHRNKIHGRNCISKSQSKFLRNLWKFSNKIAKTFSKTY